VPQDYDLDAAITRMCDATDRLLASLHDMSDADVHEPSRLPGWTRGHVLTHVARNADGLANLAEWAPPGEARPMYAGGREGRNADIEAGAARSASILESDIDAASDRLLEAFTDFPPEGLERVVLMNSSGAECAGWEIPLIREREVEIHHVDLGYDYTPAHWSAAFAERTLDQIAEGFRRKPDTPVGALHGTGTGRTWVVGDAGPTLTGPESALLAWLVGRSDGDGLTSDADGPISPAPVWS
jgi:maleylpyruvate isomerase